MNQLIAQRVHAGQDNTEHGCGSMAGRDGAGVWD